MVKPIQMNSSIEMPENIRRKDIEKYPGWQGKVSLKEIGDLLDGRDPFTYAITQGGSQDEFWLSFVREEDMAVLNIQFVKGIKGDEEQYIYKNGYFNIESTVDGIIKKIMHWDNSKPAPIPLVYY